MSILDLLQYIVNEPAPTLAGGKRRKFPEEAVVFVEKCLEKSPDVRGSPQELLVGLISLPTSAWSGLMDWIVGFEMDYRE